MRRRTSGVVAALALWPIFQAGCGGDASREDSASREVSASFPFAPDAGPVLAFSDVFEVVNSLVLEENDSVVAASPVVSYDGESFLMADIRAYQIREYAMDGSLLFAAGREGNGPGEYLAPTSATRTLDGGILVTDLLAMRSTYYSPSGTNDPRMEAHNPRTEALPFFAFKQIDLGMDRRLVAGQELSHTPGQPMHMLHIWNARTGEIERSFMADPFPEHLEPATAAFMAVEARMRGDTIWAVSQLSDSVYAFGRDGSRIGAVPLPLAHLADPDGDLWRVEEVFPLGEGEILVSVNTSGWPPSDTGSLEVTRHIARRRSQP